MVGLGRAPGFSGADARGGRGLPVFQGLARGMGGDSLSPTRFAGFCFWVSV
jgi:hypothetical protein